MSPRRVEMAPCPHRAGPALMAGESICFLIPQLMSEHRESSWNMEIPSLWFLPISLQKMDVREEPPEEGEPQ